MPDDAMTITVVVPMALAQLIDAAARADGRSRANYVRLILENLHPIPEKKK